MHSRESETRPDTLHANFKARTDKAQYQKAFFSFTHSRFKVEIDKRIIFNQRFLFNPVFSLNSLKVHQAHLKKCSFLATKK